MQPRRRCPRHFNSSRRYDSRGIRVPTTKTRTSSRAMRRRGLALVCADRKNAGDLQEHIAVVFAGAAPQAIQADAPDGFEPWVPRWQF